MAVPAMRAPFLSTLPIVNKGVNGGYEIRARQRLNPEGEFEKFLVALSETLENKDDPGDSVVIHDLDVSQNKLTPDQFGELFSTLSGLNARVVRFRLFGCPTINDEVMSHFADFLRLSTSENAPQEVHLSDCAITTEGFNTLVGALVGTDLYPYQHSGGKKLPLYLRIENNYIDNEAIMEKVNEGVLRQYLKLPSAATRVESEDAKADIIVNHLGNFRQKPGPPPDPSAAPAPKMVNDKATMQAQAAFMQQMPRPIQPHLRPPMMMNPMMAQNALRAVIARAGEFVPPPPAGVPPAFNVFGAPNLRPPVITGFATLPKNTTQAGAFVPKTPPKSAPPGLAGGNSGWNDSNNSKQDWNDSKKKGNDWKDWKSDGKKDQDWKKKDGDWKKDDWKKDGDWKKDDWKKDEGGKNDAWKKDDWKKDDWKKDDGGKKDGGWKNDDWKKDDGGKKDDGWKKDDWKKDAGQQDNWKKDGNDWKKDDWKKEDDSKPGSSWNTKDGGAWKKEDTWKQEGDWKKDSNWKTDDQKDWKNNEGKGNDWSKDDKKAGGGWKNEEKNLWPREEPTQEADSWNQNSQDDQGGRGWKRQWDGAGDATQDTEAPPLPPLPPPAHLLAGAGAAASSSSSWAKPGVGPGPASTPAKRAAPGPKPVPAKTAPPPLRQLAPKEQPALARGGIGTMAAPFTAFGSAAARNDRSRTPAPVAGRAAMNAPAPAAVTAPKTETPLPPDWEEQFDETYQRVYYWNRRTEESAWSRPTA